MTRLDFLANAWVVLCLVAFWTLLAFEMLAECGGQARRPLTVILWVVVAAEVILVFVLAALTTHELIHFWSKLAH